MGFFFLNPHKLCHTQKNPCGNFRVIVTLLTLDNTQVILNKIDTTACQYREAGVHTERTAASLPKAHVDAERTSAWAASERLSWLPTLGAGG